jgi:hypothetical protein
MTGFQNIRRAEEGKFKTEKAFKIILPNVRSSKQSSVVVKIWNPKIFSKISQHLLDDVGNWKSLKKWIRREEIKDVFF